MPITTAVGLLIGGWFAIAGRPEDDEGYTPPWWNLGYMGVCLCAIPVGIAIKVTWL